jgi:hypothetical protein
LIGPTIGLNATHCPMGSVADEIELGQEKSELVEKAQVVFEE